MHLMVPNFIAWEPQPPTMKLKNKLRSCTPLREPIVAARYLDKYYTLFYKKSNPLNTALLFPYFLILHLIWGKTFPLLSHQTVSQ